jgi:two-component system chemotaxis response regulator CheB
VRPQPSRPYRVLLVDEDLSLPSLARALFETGELVASGGGCTFQDMLRTVVEQRPDVAVVDLSGSEEPFRAIEQVMADRPTPIMVLHDSATRRAEPFKALALGALDVAERQARPAPAFWHELAKRLTLLATVRVVQHVRGKRRRKGQGGTQLTAEAPFPLVAIAASLGGPKALSMILRMLPAAFPAAICICQHISAGFTTGLAQWLGSETHLRVAEARNGDVVEPGSVFIAPSAAHLLVGADFRLELDKGPPIRGFRPSCDALLGSAARAFGRRCAGVVLTGMGRDGAAGLREVRERGGHTIAQDEATSVIFGMPREAVQLGAAAEVLAIEQIAPALIRWVESC